MATNVFDLMATLSLDTNKYQSGLTGAQNSLSSFGGAVSTGFGTVAKVGATALAAVTTAAVGVSTAFVKGTSDLAEYGDNIDKMSQKMGISAQAYQEWDAVLQHSGTSIDSMGRGMQTLQKNAVNSAEKFEALGITQEQLATMSTEELFAATISSLQDMGEGAERTALASELLGGSAKELGALLNTSSEDTQAMIDRVHELGGVMSDDAVKAAAQYQDTLQDMKTAFSGLQRGILSDFLPTVTTVMEGLTALFSGDEGGIAKITEGIDDFVNKLSAGLPQVLEIGAEIITSLASAITENLPQLTDASIKAIGTLANGIIDNAPMIIDSLLTIGGMIKDKVLELGEKLANWLRDVDWKNIASQAAEYMSQAVSIVSDFARIGFDIINSLGKGIAESAPELLPAAINMIADFCNFLAEQAPQLISTAADIVIGLAKGLTNPTSLGNLVTSAVNLIMALADGLLEALPKLIEAAPEIIQNLVVALVENAPKLSVAGWELIIKLAFALIEAIPELIKAIPEIIGALVVGFIDGVGAMIEAGESLMDTLKETIMSFDPFEWGKDLVDSFIDGILSMIDSVEDAVSEVAETIADFLGFSEPDKGALSNFHTYAPDMMKLFTKGVKDNTKLITDQIEDSFDFEDIIMNQKYKGKGVNVIDNTYGGMVQNLTINAPTELNPSEIARQTRNANREFVLQMRMA